MEFGAVERTGRRSLLVTQSGIRKLSELPHRNQTWNLRQNSLQEPWLKASSFLKKRSRKPRPISINNSRKAMRRLMRWWITARNLGRELRDLRRLLAH